MWFFCAFTYIFPLSTWWFQHVLFLFDFGLGSLAELVQMSDAFWWVPTLWHRELLSWPGSCGTMHTGNLLSHLLFYFLPLASLLPIAILYRNDIVLKPTISQDYFFVFSRSKNWQGCVRWWYFRIVLKPLSPALNSTCGFFTILARGMTQGVSIIRF